MTVVVFIALAIVTQGQREYEDCVTNYSVFEEAVFQTNNNLYKLTTTFYPPDKDNPLYVSVTYKFLNTNESVNYQWSSASLYLTIKPSTIRYLSLFFCYIEDDRIVELELELPGECENLTQIQPSNASNFLFVFTHRVTKYILYIERGTMGIAEKACTCIYRRQDMSQNHLRYIGHWNSIIDIILLFRITVHSSS